MSYLVLAFYNFEKIENPQLEVAHHKAFLEAYDAKSRIYISEEGINAQMSIAKEHAAPYIDWLRSQNIYKNADIKEHIWHEHVFPRLTVKYRKNLVARDGKIDLTKRGRHLKPIQFRKVLESEKDFLLIDVRNDYEWKVGHFKGAELPPCENFREFETYAQKLKERVQPDTKVLMYCTGGIRCELYSSLLIEHGIKNVFQLEGGVIKYGLEEGSANWQGKLFVFDDRLTVPISEEETPVIGTCLHCQAQCESYYNCANMDCNELFLCCPTCISKFAGCCQLSCSESKRVRPYHEQNPHKPFKRSHHYAV